MRLGALQGATGMKSLDFALILKTTESNIRMKMNDMRNVTSTEEARLTPIRNLIDWDFVLKGEAPAHTFSDAELKRFKDKRSELLSRLPDLNYKISTLDHTMPRLRKQRTTVANLLTKEEVQKDDTLLRVFEFTRLALEDRYGRESKKYFELKLKINEINANIQLLEQWLQEAGTTFD
jgi:hypothetical protein